jgi:uncharacterized membrane protein YGL010W
MKTAAQQLTKYAAYHRDRRNIVTHFIGIPMIVLAVVILLSRPILFSIGNVPVSLACIACAAAGIYYMKLDLRLGAAMVALLMACWLIAQSLAPLSTTAWLVWGLGLFIVGWGFQFVGHFYEGKKPAFVDDLMGLIIGPFFVVAELFFMVGTCKDLQEIIEREVGPTLIRTSTKSA